MISFRYPLLVYEHGQHGSYYKSIIAYMNDDFIDKPMATFPALFCYVRMGNT